MGKSMYNFGKNTKEKARQLKQMDKASKRLAAKQNRDTTKSTAPGDNAVVIESNRVADIANGTV